MSGAGHMLHKNFEVDGYHAEIIEIVGRLLPNEFHEDAIIEVTLPNQKRVQYIYLDICYADMKCVLNSCIQVIRRLSTANRLDNDRPTNRIFR